MPSQGRGVPGSGVIVGNPGPTHVGAHFLGAARSLGIRTALADVRGAYAATVWSRIRWRLGDRRPRRLAAFGRSVVDLCREHDARWLLATGLAPLDAGTLDALRHHGVRLLNFLTDDPWNPRQRAHWFMQALPAYDHVFSPRRSNLDDLVGVGCRAVSSCAFAYAPEVHYRTEAAAEANGLDVVFVGGADRERLPYVHALADANVDVALYGGYWGSDPIARRFHRGFADAATVRAVTSRARLSLCLVRRANRDGHVMRSFEIPAMGGCMIAEDTPDHRSVFGPDGEAVLYFASPGDLVRRVLEIREDGGRRSALADRAHRMVVDGHHTYADRLARMLETAGLGAALTAAPGADSSTVGRAR